MKAVIVDSSVRQSLHGIKNDSRSTAGKTSPTSKQTDFDSNEMRECFHQLQKMLPRYQGERWSDHVDKTELLQRVIDYIVDLRMLLVLDRGSCIFGSGRGSRKPLADRTGGDNTKHNFKTDRTDVSTTRNFLYDPSFDCVASQMSPFTGDHANIRPASK